MGRPAVFLVMCGSSVASANLAAVKLKDEAQRRKVKAIIRVGKIADMDVLIERQRPDIVVATAQTTKKHDGVKVYSGVPLISTVGQEELYDEIFAYIEEQGLGK